MAKLIDNERGFSLVEIMIASSLSLVLIAGVLQIYQSSKTTYNLQNELADLQENERIALSVLTTNIRMTGFARDVPVFPFIDTVDDPVNTSFKLTQDGGGTNNDRITIKFQSNTDCLGEDTSGVGFAVNTFFIENEELKCRGNGTATGGNPTTVAGTAQPLASNIESMQILYGVNTSSNATDSAPNRYVNIGDSALASDMSNVTGVRIALLIRSSGSVKPQTESADFTLLDSPTLSYNDNHKRQLVTTTILLRNSL